MRSATVPPDFGLNQKLSMTSFHRPYLCIGASARFYDIYFLVIIIPFVITSPVPFSVLCMSLGPNALSCSKQMSLVHWDPPCTENCRYFN
jgi:hypothetical protein